MICGKKQIHSVCGNLCGQRGIWRRNLKLGFPPSATVQTASEVSIWSSRISGLSSQTKCLTDRLRPDIRLTNEMRVLSVCGQPCGQRGIWSEDLRQEISECATVPTASGLVGQSSWMPHPSSQIKRDTPSLHPDILYRPLEEKGPASPCPNQYSYYKRKSFLLQDFLACGMLKQDHETIGVRKESCE